MSGFATDQPRWWSAAGVPVSSPGGGQEVHGYMTSQGVKVGIRYGAVGTDFELAARCGHSEGKVKKAGPEGPRAFGCPCYLSAPGGRHPPER